MLGGLRDPFSIWDVFDTRTENGLGAGAALTGVVGIEDVLDVAGHVGQRGTPSADPLSDASGPSYHTRFDRGGPQPGGDPWDLAPANGSIGLGDILDAANQFGLMC